MESKLYTIDHQSDILKWLKKTIWPGEREIACINTNYMMSSEEFDGTNGRPASQPSIHPSILYHSHHISMTSITVTKNISIQCKQETKEASKHLLKCQPIIFTRRYRKMCVRFIFRLVFCQKFFLCRCCRQFICVVTACELGKYMGAIYSSTCKQVCRKDNRIQIWRRHTNQPNNKLLHFAELLK